MSVIVQSLKGAVAQMPKTLASQRERRVADELLALYDLLGLSREEFSARFGIPTDDLAEWEQTNDFMHQNVKAALMIETILNDPEGAAKLAMNASKR